MDKSVKYWKRAISGWKMGSVKNLDVATIAFPAFLRRLLKCNSDMDMSFELLSRWDIHHILVTVWVLSKFFSMDASLQNEKFLAKSFDNNGYYVFFLLFIFLWNAGARSSLLGVHGLLRRGSGEVSADLCSVVCSDNTHKNGSKLYQESFRLSTWRFFMAKGLLKHWNRLSREGTDAQGLSVFKRHLNSALTTCLGQPWTGQGVDHMIIVDPSQLK